VTATSIGIVEPEGLPHDWQDRRWECSSLSLTPARLATAHPDARWTIRYAVALHDGALAALLPLYRSTSPSIADYYHDPGRQFSAVPCGSPDARAWLIVGGALELAGGFLVRPATVDPWGIRAALARAAAELARQEACSIAAFYVREPELGPFLQAWGDTAVTVDAGDAAEITLPFSTVEDYLESLGGHRQRRIRKDWRDFDALGLTSAEEPITALLEEAAELIVAQRARHGVNDHPKLATYRLRRWSSAAQGRYVCFTVRDASGKLLAACFACDAGDALEVYDIGLTGDPAVRLAAYLEAAYYAPIRYALRSGCARLELGLGAGTAKQLKGAVFTPVRSVCLPG
jgi:hypothetical protein